MKFAFIEQHASIWPVNVAWHFQRLEERGVLEKRNSRHFFVDRPTAQIDGL